MCQLFTTHAVLKKGLKGLCQKVSVQGFCMVDLHQQLDITPAGLLNKV